MQTTGVSAPEVARLFQEVRKLVPLFARRYRSRGVAFEDLVGAGNLGVVEAAHRFDPDRGVKFDSYAAWWIRKAIVESLRSETNVVAIPRFAAKRRQHVMEAMKRGRSSGESDRSPNEVAAELGLSARQAMRSAAMSTRVVSMHDPVASDCGDCWEDRLARPAAEGPEAIAMDAERVRAATEAFHALPPRQREVVALRYGGSGNDDAPTPLKDVARVMGLSPERVRQIECKALAELRLKLARAAKKRSRG